MDGKTVRILERTTFAKPSGNIMTSRSYTLLMTPLDFHASCDELIRIYEYVRCNINAIAPFLPDSAVVDIAAGGTPHNLGRAPLLRFSVLAEGSIRDDIHDRLQDAIDEWMIARDPDSLDLELSNITFPTWEYVLRVSTFPEDASDPES